MNTDPRIEQLTVAQVMKTQTNGLAALSPTTAPALRPFSNAMQQMDEALARQQQQIDSLMERLVPYSADSVGVAPHDAVPTFGTSPLVRSLYGFIERIDALTDRLNAICLGVE